MPSMEPQTTMNALIAMRPTASESLLISKHLDRLAAEDLDGRTFDHQRLVLASLSASP